MSRRATQRYPFFRSIRYQSAGYEHSGVMEDISTNGLRVRSRWPFRCGEQLVLILPIRDAHSEAEISSVRGEVVWSEGYRAGVRFVAPPHPFVERLESLLDQYLLHASAKELDAFVRDTRSEEESLPS
jgi:hypothetical protein